MPGVRVIKAELLGCDLPFDPEREYRFAAEEFRNAEAVVRQAVVLRSIAFRKLAKITTERMRHAIAKNHAMIEGEVL